MIHIWSDRLIFLAIFLLLLTEFLSKSRICFWISQQRSAENNSSSPSLPLLSWRLSFRDTGSWVRMQRNKMLLQTLHGSYYLRFPKIKNIKIPFLFLQNHQEIIISKEIIWATIFLASKVESLCGIFQSLKESHQDHKPFCRGKVSADKCYKHTWSGWVLYRI